MRKATVMNFLNYIHHLICLQNIPKRFLLTSGFFWWRYQIQNWLLDVVVKYYVIFNNSWQQKKFLTLSFGKWKVHQLSIAYQHGKLVDVIYMTVIWSKILVVGHGLYFQSYALIIFMKSYKVSNSFFVKFRKGQHGDNFALH